MTPLFIDVETGKTAVGGDWTLFWWSEGNGCCDCNRAMLFGEDVETEMDRRVGNNPEECGGNCFGWTRFIAVDIHGETLVVHTKTEVLTAINNRYSLNLVEKAKALFTQHVRN